MNMRPKELVRCPKCGSSDVRYSYTQTKWDLIMDLFFSMDAFRCRSCRARFHKFDPSADDEPTPQSHQERAGDQPK